MVFVKYKRCDKKIPPLSNKIVLIAISDYQLF